MEVSPAPTMAIDVQVAFKGWSPYENGEITSDSYWEDTWLNAGVYKDYLAKICYATSGPARAPSGGRC